MLELPSDLLETAVNQDFIIVVGYDNVGKGLVLDSVREFLNTKCTFEVPVFHPDYTITGKHTPPEGRWTYFMYLTDFISKMRETFAVRCPMLIDRCALCGAVYNIDASIAEDYASRLTNSKLSVLHILVTTDEESYYKFQESRGSDQKFTYDDYKFFTRLYKEFLDKYHIPYYEFNNAYDDTYADSVKGLCITCGHWKTNKCINPNGRSDTTWDMIKCKHSSDKEVQDID